MKRFFAGVIISTVFSITGHSQTADQIINKHLEITGGINKWKGLNSTVIKGEMILGLNESYPIEIYQQRPNLNKTVLNIQGKRVILNGYSGKKAVQFNFYSNRLENSIDYTPESFDSDLVDYSRKGFQAVLVGTEKIDHSSCYKIKLIKNTNTLTYYFDMKTYQLMRESNPEETKTYSDFRENSSLVFPYRIEVKSNNDEFDFVLLIKSIDVNKFIPEKEFNF